ncbi:thiolase family protein [Actinomycetospora straminea]|uniref:propanoyl-CoA C-acyltransferase n=1 Tax=Actinomycetospora straminea TaxID=663607 RepID=A0ABP9EJ35_9PSEU|nr:thiolase family protein [Actinomycetospora straminea]MDD7933794.1 thiolase family protein [Actinomycetospora straminea]
MTSHIIGASTTAFGRRPEVGVKELAREAVDGALEDAGTTLDAVEAVFFSTAMQGALEGQHAVAGQIAMRDMGFQRGPVFNVENACASGDTALLLAESHVRAGNADVVLAVGVERMTADKAGSFAWFHGAWDVHDADATTAGLLALGADVPTPDGVAEPAPEAKSLFMDVYAALAKYHMKRYGLTDRQLAAVAAKDHRHSVHNPWAQYRRPFSVDEVLAAPTISWPIRLPMCAPMSDGAAAVLVCSDRVLGRHGDRARSVPIAAVELASGQDRSPDDLDRHLSVVASTRAYERAGIGPEDVDVAELHDATSFGEILQSENLGLVARGNGGAAAERGETTLGGRIPINVSGGLVSKGHPIAATGLAKTFELVTQLRGEAGDRQVPGARWTISQSGGGFYGVEDASTCVTILGGK